MNVTILNYVTIVYLQLLWHQLTSRTLFVTKPCATVVPRLGQLIVAWDLPRWAQSFALFFKGVEEGPWQPWQSGVETLLLTCDTWIKTWGERQPWSTLGVFGCWSCAKKCGASNNTMSSMSPNCRLVQRCFKVGTGASGASGPARTAPYVTMWSNSPRRRSQERPRPAGRWGAGSRLCGSFF